MQKHFTGLVAALLCSLTAFAQDLDATRWVTDTPPGVIARSGNTLYLGGSFQTIGPKTGGGATLNVLDGTLPAVPVSEITGKARTSVPDGNGGWYVGGDFIRVGNLVRPGLVHIRADGQADPDWEAGVSGGLGVVTTLALADNILYVGGYFASLGGQPRNGLAAVDARTGRVTAWNPQPGFPVTALAVAGNTVYLGGRFSEMGGQKRSFLAAVDAASGALTAWNPNPNAEVSHLAVVGSTVYALGAFDAIGGESRQYLAALDAGTGNANGWNPGPDGRVSAISVAGNTIYVGGDFASIGGQARQRLAAFDATTGQVTPWHPAADAEVTTLAVSGNAVVLGGKFKTINGRRNHYLAAVDAATGESFAWSSGANGAVLTSSLVGGSLFVGGEFTSVGMHYRNTLAAVDAATGEVVAWNPGATLKNFSGPRNMIVAGGKVCVGGEHYMIDDEYIEELVTRKFYVFDATTGAVVGGKHSFDGNIYAMAAAGNTLYLGGTFSAINGQIREKLASIDLTTDQLTAWSPRPGTTETSNSFVMALEVQRGILYAGGSFVSMNDLPRNNLVAFDATSGEVTPWNPDILPFGNVNSLAFHGNNVYVPGFFLASGQQNSRSMLVLDATTGRFVDWQPQYLSNDVYKVAVAGNLIYLGGRYSLVNGPDLTGLAAFDANTGQWAPWRANVVGGISALLAYEDMLYVSGDFQLVQGQSSPGFAAFRLNASFSRIEGKAYEDTNGDCVQNNGEKGIAGRIVVAKPGDHFAYTDSLGNYAMLINPGRYTLSQVLPAHVARTTRLVCPVEPTGDSVQVARNTTLTGKNFAIQTVSRPHLTVGVSSDRRRRCFTGITTVSYCNDGTGVAQDVQVHVQLPEYVALVRAKQPFTQDREGNYVFTIGTVAAGTCGTIQLVDSVVCNNPNIRGLTQCTRAWITPGNDQILDPQWDRSDITLKARCGNNGRVRLALYNSGTGGMADSSAYRIYLDAQLAFTRNFKLALGDSLVLQVPANGRTVRLEAYQRPAHPDKRQSNITLEGCGTNSAGTVSTGYVDQLPQDDEEPEVAVECLPIIDSFDPNDKAVSPAGVTDRHYTPTGRALDYVVRFQNTGTDVAYQVVVVDTLSEHLDISTLRVGAVSHPYKLHVSGKGRPVLTFTFKDINLPDSTADEPRSHGRIQFSIRPKTDLPEKTRVENFADIFFDYNEPVRTNTTVNTLYDLPPVVAADVALAPSDVCPAANPVANAGANRTVCEQDTVKLAAGQPLEGNGRWKLVRGAGTVGEPNRPDATVTALAYGENVFQWRVPASRCGSDSLAASVTITRLQKPVAVITQSGADQLVCSVAGSRYEWFLDGAKLDKGGQRIQVTRSGRYTVRVEMADGCHPEVSEAYAYGVTGLVPGATAAVRVFPNPTTGRLVVHLPVSPGGPVHATVVDKIGRTVLSQMFNPAGSVGEFRAELDLSAQATGLYVLKLQTTHGLVVRSVFKK